MMPQGESKAHLQSTSAHGCLSRGAIHPPLESRGFLALFCTHQRVDEYPDDQNHGLCADEPPRADTAGNLFGEMLPRRDVLRIGELHAARPWKSAFASTPKTSRTAPNATPTAPTSPWSPSTPTANPPLFPHTPCAPQL